MNVIVVMSLNILILIAVAIDLIRCWKDISEREKTLEVIVGLILCMLLAYGIHIYNDPQQVLILR